MTRVAFTMFGGDGWTGGLNYLRNLFSALAELPGRPVEPVLFVAPSTRASALSEITPYLAQDPVLVPEWDAKGPVRLRRLFHSALLQNDSLSQAVFEAHRIDVVFVHAAWYGLRFQLPTLAWIADFQHRHLPHMFNWSNRLRRDLGYAALSRCATAVMLSSEDARRDCEQFFPRSRGKTRVLPFAVRLDPKVMQIDAAAVARRHGLPERFFYLPNQLWKHKNHLNLLRALRILHERGISAVVVASGSAKDNRNPDHPGNVLAMAGEPALAKSFRFLGLVPYEDLMPLMKASVAVINPSLFEGWSTTVEEAKALGVPLLLSDLRVHREQTSGAKARYFDPHSPPAIADTLAEAWLQSDSGRQAAEIAAVQRYARARFEFGSSFAKIVEGLIVR